MSTQNPYRFDVFISYCPADQAWVEDWLLPRLEGAGLRVGTGDTAFILGAPKLRNVEQAVQDSRRVVVVLTPDWLESELAEFEASLLRYSDPAARRRKLLPLLLKPCELPETITALKLEPADFMVEKNWEREYRRLRRDIEDAIPVPFPLQHEAGGLQGWLKWLRRYRREMFRGVLGFLPVWFISFSLLQLPPFQPRPGWQPLGLHVKGLQRLVRVEDTLLASTDTDFEGCDPANTGDSGLWRSANRGEDWDYVRVPALEFSRPGQGCVLAAITNFAYAPSMPQRIYASTSDVGLLASDDTGETWAPLGADSLPDTDLRTAAVSPNAPEAVWAAASTRHVFRWLANEGRWQMVDGGETCAASASGEASLPPDLSVGVILATDSAIYLATDEGLDQPGPNSGIYRSQDGGNCWKRIDDAQERYTYKAMASIPGTAAEQVLVLSVDQNLISGKPNHQLWLLDGEQRRTPELWATGNAAGRLYVEPGSPPTWYIISDLGEIFRGPVDTRGSEKLPTLKRCLLPPTCLTDFAQGFDAGPPLILAGNRVYRWTEVPWRRSLWP